MRTLFLTEVTRRKLQIDKDISVQRHVVYDKALLKLALFNLIDNAVKYSFSENVVTVIGTVVRGQYHLSVHNIGPFIPSGEIRDQIFEPFRRIKYSGVQTMPGTGLGLAATRRIVEVHGGIVRVKSIPDPRGNLASPRAKTIFTITIPQE